MGHPIQDLNEAATARYLTGSIDLVYFDGQCYHIADYKSNYLGADQRDYEKTNLEHNMTQSSYWLQAALYLVALHRYLGSRLQDIMIFGNIWVEPVICICVVCRGKQGKGFVIGGQMRNLFCN